MFHKARFHRVAVNVTDFLQKGILSGDPEGIWVMFINRVFMAMIAFLYPKLCERTLVSVRSKMVNHRASSKALQTICLILSFWKMGKRL
jgi:hypothetical protein